MKDNAQITLALQQQMANENKSLDETDAGQELRAGIIKEREKFEKSLAEVQKQTAEALQDRDKASAKALREIQDDYRYRIDQLERARINLKTDLEELHEDKYRKIEARLQEAENRHQEQLREMERDRLRRESAMLREKHAAEQREMEATAALQKLQLQENPSYFDPMSSTGIASQSDVSTSTSILR